MMEHDDTVRNRPHDVAPVRLADLADLAGSAAPARDTEVTGIVMDSRSVQPGDLYVAVAGSSTHGIRFAPEALALGAAAIWTDGQGAMSVPSDVPLIVSDTIRARLGRVSAAVYDDPTARLGLIGVTGTQGKTTTTYLAEAALRSVGAIPAVVGTIGTRIDGRSVSSALTTPESPVLQALFATMIEEGVQTCAMEVSSHALVKGRVDAVRFDVAVFLNLGRDHLDFHADLDDYFAAKAQLFTPQYADSAVIDVDDAFGRRLLALTGIDAQTMSVQGASADWMAVNLRPQRLGTSVTVVTPDRREVELTVPLVGTFNVANALAAVAALSRLGYDPQDMCAGIASAAGVPGRMERIEAGQDFLAVVDYAHKPDAVEAVLRALRPVTPGRLIVVIGAGGDRDRGKRALMGQIAGRHADLLIVTDDNPRSEEPSAIRAAILVGARSGSAEVLEIGDRAEAIAAALARAREGDTVVVAGKGHERGQEIDGIIEPFDDRDVVRSWLERRS